MHRVYSFDVFDTCLTRVFSNFGDVFLSAAKRILNRTNVASTGMDCLALVALRLNAEKEARRRSSKEDIRLEAIYACFPENNRFGVGREEMMAAELAEEALCIRPIPAMRERIQRLRKRGQRIIFISDMYLPVSFIRNELEKNDFSKPHDNIYVSGEVGKTKHTGNLFKFACQQERIPPSQLVHTGDNAHGDIKICSKLGIHTRPYLIGRQDRWERLVISQTPSHSLEVSRLAGAVRQARLAAENVVGDPLLAEIAAGAVAPVLVAFTAWVLKNAVDQEMDCLYFVSRDGKILLSIANVIRKRRKVPDCRYLFGSRQAWFLPATKTVDQSSLTWLLVEGHSRRPADLIRKLNLTPDDLYQTARSLGLKEQFWRKPLCPSSEKSWWQLLDRPEVVSMVQNEIRQARKLTIAYLGQSGFSQKRRTALVDVGWTLKTQRACDRLLSLGGYGILTAGYYLGVVSDAVNTSETPVFNSFFQELPRHIDQQQRHNFIFRNANLIEQIFTGNTDGTVLGYRWRNNIVEPILADGESNPDKTKFFRAVETAVITFSKACPDSFLDWPKRRLLRLAEAHLSEFICRSGSDLTRRISGYLVKDDQLESRSRRLARPISLSHVFLALLNRYCPSYGGGYSRSFDWIEGSLELSNPIIKRLMRTNAGFELIRTYRKSC